MKVNTNTLLRQRTILLERKEMQEFVRKGTVTCIAVDGEEITVSCRELEILSKREEKTDANATERDTGDGSPDQDIPRDLQPA